MCLGKTTLNFEKLKSKEWVYVASRETSILLHSLYAESFKSMEKFGFGEFAKCYINQTFICLKGLIGFYYRDKNPPLNATEVLKQKLDKDKELLLKTYKKAIKESKETEKVIFLFKEKKLLENINLSLYKKLRLTFITFFPLQVFPLLVERMFSKENKKLFEKNQELLVRWRKETHVIQSEFEKLFEKFVVEFSNKEGIDFRYYTDYELLDYFENGKEVPKEVFDSRKKSSLLIRCWDKNPPYVIFTSKESQDFCDFLKEKCKPKNMEDVLKGTIACKGFVKGNVFLINEKKDFKGIPIDSIVIAKVVEMDDLDYLLKNKIKAIVTEEGGMTCHAAIVSREFEIPCIVGVDDATEAFKSSDYVEVNADKGEIKKLS